MKTYGGVDTYLHTFLTLALVESECSSPGCFSPGKRGTPYLMDRKLGEPLSLSERYNFPVHISPVCYVNFHPENMTRKAIFM
jgi:hypothetical protein